MGSIRPYPRKIRLFGASPELVNAVSALLKRLRDSSPERLPLEFSSGQDDASEVPWIAFVLGDGAPDVDRSMLRSTLLAPHLFVDLESTFGVSCAARLDRSFCWICARPPAEVAGSLIEHYSGAFYDPASRSIQFAGLSDPEAMITLPDFDRPAGLELLIAMTVIYIADGAGRVRSFQSLEEAVQESPPVGIRPIAQLFDLSEIRKELQ